MSVITISGSQGQGKSTVLNSIADLGYSVVERKTSRSILSDWGYTLNEVNRYPPLTRAFQEEILRRHYESMKPLLDSPSLHFMERSFADIFTYAVCAIGSFNEYNSWMEDYWERCVEFQSEYQSIYHLTGRSFIPQDDGVRSTGRFFGSMVDREILLNLKAMDERIGGNQLLSISYTDNTARVDTILKHCCTIEMFSIDSKPAED